MILTLELNKVSSFVQSRYNGHSEGSATLSLLTTLFPHFLVFYCICDGNSCSFKISISLLYYFVIIIIIIIIASQRSDMVSDEQKLVLSENEVVPH